MTSGLRDGPFILESLGLELGLFCLLQDAGASRWDSFIFRVLCSELDVHLYSWGIWIPSPILDVPGPRAGSTLSSPGFWGLPKSWQLTQQAALFILGVLGS